jgi:hypothetical protein
MTTHENLEKFKECPDDLPKLPPWELPGWKLAV